MTTITCPVCGANEEPGRDHTCPVCGADLPAAAPEVDDTGDPGAPVADVPEAPTFGQPAPEGAPLGEPATDMPSTTEVPPPADAPAADVPSAPTSPLAGPVPPPPPGSTAGPSASSRPSPYDPSHPSGLSSSLRTYGMLTHLSAFAGALIALGFVGPLVMWLIRRDEHPFVDHHGKEAVNFNLSMLLYLVVGIVGSFATLGLGLVVVVPAAIVFFVTWVVTTIVAAVKANNGEGYRYPLTIRFIKD